MKRCSACKMPKFLSEFYSNNSRKDGLSHDCKKCNKERSTSFRIKSPDKVKKSLHTWYQNNKGKVRLNDKKWRLANKDKIRKASLVWYNNNKEKMRSSRKKWVALNPEKHMAGIRRYQLTHLNATPPWAKEIMKIYTLQMYRKARELTETTGVKHEVDHIHPLRGKNFNGLHLPWNLQVISASENRSKGNKITEVLHS
jgi:hypothetical protein